MNNNAPNQPPANKRANRAALREYYNLRAAATPRIELPDSEVPASEIDTPGFKTDEYIAKVVAESGLEDLLRLYTRVVGEVRALDAEKKALVYDNYSKLIAATETIHKVGKFNLDLNTWQFFFPLNSMLIILNQMRSNMDPLNPMASTLNPAVAQIYSQASEIRETLRKSIPAPDSEEGMKRRSQLQKQRTKELAVQVLATPERLRSLVKEGKLDEARAEWEMPRRLLETWKEKGLGGGDVQDCIDEGDAALHQHAEQEGARPPKDGQ